MKYLRVIFAEFDDEDDKLLDSIGYLSIKEGVIEGGYDTRNPEAEALYKMALKTVQKVLKGADIDKGFFVPRH